MKKLMALCVLFSSCGYQIHEDFQDKESLTLSIPFIKGDSDGRLTDEIIRSISSCTSFVYSNQGAERILKVEILSEETEQIGYSYDREDGTNKLIKDLTPVEGRKKLTVEVTLLDAFSDTPIIGPKVVTAFSDYDFVDSDNLNDLIFFPKPGISQSVLTFSLGQLEANENAQDVALIPLYRSIARKIVEGLLFNL